MAIAESQEYIVVGRLSGLYGVRGWFKVYSHTEPRDNILGYDTWYLREQKGWKACSLKSGRVHGKGIVAQLEGIDDRDLATALLGRDIAIHPEQLAEPEEGEFYWAELIGLRVVTLEGVELGQVDHLLETGANDVLVVKGEQEHLLPYIPDQVVRKIDLDGGEMVVDWDPEF